MVKTYNTFDFKSADKRVEKTKVDPYKVQLEDYENINELVERSIRTKTPFKPEKISGAIYDSDQIIDEWLSETGIQKSEPKADEVSKSDVKDEQSEVKTADALTQDGPAKI